MPIPGAAVRRAAIAGLALLLSGCTAPEAGPRGRIEGVERVEVARGRHVDALRAAGRVTVELRRATLRARLAAARPGGSGAGCTLEGPGGIRRELVPREARGAGRAGPVEARLGRGAWSVRCAGGARLEEPRLLGRADGPGRLVVLVVVDTLRDDFVSTAAMPRTVSALAGARRFADVRANASWTLPSLASAMTSRPVLELTAPDGTLIGVPPEAVTIAERLRAAGFSTAAFVANATLREGNGFGQGFGRFVTTGEPSDPPPDAAPVLAEARTWIGEHRGEDAFVWIHLMEPHEPLRDHAGRGRAAVPSRILAGRERPASASEAAAFRELYRLEVAHADALLGAFLDELPPSAIVALTADHGEMLGEGSVWGHGLTLYEPVLRVPLLLRAPGAQPGRDDQPGELLDLVPTLLGRVGPGPDVAGLAGADLFAGPRRDRPRLAATFSAGPLRWSYRRGELLALAHFAPQPSAAATSHPSLQELDPLPVGVWEYGPGEEPVGRTGRPLAGAALAEVAAAFARDVGSLVPGYQALAVDRSAGSELAFAVAGTELPVWIHATAAARLTRAPGGVSLSWPAPQPLVLVSFGGAAPVRPLGAGWRLGDRTPPPPTAPGLVLWRNPRAATRQHPQAEILEHLRALGYLR